MTYEVDRAIQNTPFAEPARHWYIQRGRDPQDRRAQAKRGVRFRPEERPRSMGPYRRHASPLQARRRRERLRRRLRAGTREHHPWVGGRVASRRVTRTTLELLGWWQRDGRQQRLFFAQLEAAETIIVLREARQDLLEGWGWTEANFRVIEWTPQSVLTWE
jgi:type III restriction enzyme